MSNGVIKNNRIPRKFNQIIGRMLIDTNLDKKGDILHICKNDFDGYLALNQRTNKYACCFVSMLRNAEVFELIQVI